MSRFQFRFKKSELLDAECSLPATVAFSLHFASTTTITMFNSNTIKRFKAQEQARAAYRAPSVLERRSTVLEGLQTGPAPQKMYFSQTAYDLGFRQIDVFGRYTPLEVFTLATKPTEELEILLQEKERVHDVAIDGVRSSLEGAEFHRGQAHECQGHVSTINKKLQELELAHSLKVQALQSERALEEAARDKHLQKAKEGDVTAVVNIKDLNANHREATLIKYLTDANDNKYLSNRSLKDIRNLDGLESYEQVAELTTTETVETLRGLKHLGLGRNSAFTERELHTAKGNALIEDLHVRLMSYLWGGATSTNRTAVDSSGSLGNPQPQITKRSAADATVLESSLGSPAPPANKSRTGKSPAVLKAELAVRQAQLDLERELAKGADE